MAFTATRGTDDRFSPAPDSFGFSTVYWDIVNTAGSTGGDIITPFSRTEDIEIVGFTPTVSAAEYPGISAVALNAAGQVVVTVVNLADLDYGLRLRGRGL